MRSNRNISPSSMSDKENSVEGSALRRTRRRLKERFEDQFAYEAALSPSPARRSCRRSPDRPRSVFTHSFALPMLPTSWAGVPVPQIPGRVLRSGANTLSRTLNSVQTTFDTLSQKFRRSTKRRQQLKNEPCCSPVTPQTKSRHLLGRTPTKLYSPFGIETPCRRRPGDADRARTPKDRNVVQKNFGERLNANCSNTHVIVNETVIMEKKFDPDMEEVRIGIWELRQTAHKIIKRSSLQH